MWKLRIIDLRMLFFPNKEILKLWIFLKDLLCCNLHILVCYIFTIIQLKIFSNFSCDVVFDLMIN